MNLVFFCCTNVLGTMQAIAIREATEKEMEIERLKRELEEAKNKLTVVEGQKDTFKVG